MASNTPTMPLWVKLVCTAWTVALAPTYWKQYGPANFLWFSDLALFMTLAALWLDSRWLLGMAAVCALLPELVWNVGFFARLLMGFGSLHTADYMFDPNYPPAVRALSLFHVWLPPLWFWMLHRLGYERRAWLAQTLVAWVVLPASYLFTKPAADMNWVYGPGGKTQHALPPLVYLGLLMIVLPLCAYLPTHLLLKRLKR